MEILVQTQVINENHKYFKELDKLCFLSKNIYNTGLYHIRKVYQYTESYLSYCDLVKYLIKENQKDYRALPAKVSNHTLMLLDKNYKSFFALIKKDKMTRPPRYLHSIKGRQVIFYEKGALSFKKQGYIRLSQTNIYIPLIMEKDEVQFVRIVPKGNHFNIEIGKRVETPKSLKDNSRYASIDIGVNNLATVTSNVDKPFIINGKPIKSINHYCNKEVSKKQSEIETKYKIKTCKKIKKLYQKRDNKIKDYFHKSSKYITDYLVSNQINTLVIGKNTGWKQSINIGKKNNQNFVQIPFMKFISMLEYKCRLKGIMVITNEESYTSKCSFFDGEEICKHEKYLGKRIKRGLFRTSTGKLINADCNGSYNILKKYLLSTKKATQNLMRDCVKAYSMPTIIKLRTS